jgi:hypothetical protein
MLKTTEFSRSFLTGVKVKLSHHGGPGSKPGLVMWDLWWTKVALGQVFSEYFGFPCQSSFHQFFFFPQSHIIWGWYNRPVVAAVPRDPV